MWLPYLPQTLMLWKAFDDEQCAGSYHQHRQIAAKSLCDLQGLHSKPDCNEQYGCQYQFACLAGVKFSDNGTGRPGSAVAVHPKGEIAVGNQCHQSPQQTGVASYPALESPQDERYCQGHNQLQHQNREGGRSVKGGLVGRSCVHSDPLGISADVNRCRSNTLVPFCPAAIARGV